MSAREKSASSPAPQEARARREGSLAWTRYDCYGQPKHRRPRGSGDPVALARTPLDSRLRGNDEWAQPAIALMRAIISSTALSTGTFSLTTRFMALAQTFSLLMIVNL